MEIVEDFDEQSYNNNGNPSKKSLNILRVETKTKETFGDFAFVVFIFLFYVFPFISSVVFPFFLSFFFFSVSFSRVLKIFFLASIASRFLTPFEIEAHFLEPFREVHIDLETLFFFFSFFALFLFFFFFSVVLKIFCCFNFFTICYESSSKHIIF